ncbi:MAG: hypothetical protein IPM77_02255 [Crocinitomicaceae bacterium]|nr:hypothetical protein [Crocinitomicaceae bacterium]
MKKFNVAFFMLFLFAVNVKTFMAQEWLIFKIYETGDLNSKLPFFDDYFYSEIAYARTERNTDLFELHGRVRMIEQRVFRDSVNFVANENLIWQFDENQNLIKFTKGDSSDHGGWLIEEFEYDEAGHLIKRKTAQDTYGDFSYCCYIYDIRGFLTERIDSFHLMMVFIILRLYLAMKMIIQNSIWSFFH